MSVRLVTISSVWSRIFKVEKTNLFFCSFDILILTDLQGGYGGVVGIILHSNLQLGHVPTPLTEKKEEGQVEGNLDPETEVMRKETDAHEDDERQQGLPIIDFLFNFLAK